jgi:hypothetical protein
MTMTRYSIPPNKGAEKAMGSQNSGKLAIAISAIGVGLTLGLANGAAVNLDGCRGAQEEYLTRFRTPCPAQGLTCDEDVLVAVTSEGEPLELTLESKGNCAPIMVHVEFNDLYLGSTDYISDDPANGYPRRTKPLIANPTFNGRQRFELKGEAKAEGCGATGNLPSWGGVALIRKLPR